MHSGTFSSIPSLYPLEASNIPPSNATCPLGAKSSPVENHRLRASSQQKAVPKYMCPCCQMQRLISADILSHSLLQVFYQAADLEGSHYIHYYE